MTMLRSLLFRLTAISSAISFAISSANAAVSVSLSDTVVAPRIGIGVGVNIATVSACPVDDSSFEGAATSSDGN